MRGIAQLRVEEAILGFDAREPVEAPPTDWPPVRREAYLLRPDVPRPLSVDPLVWPSLLEEGSDAGTPEWRGPNGQLWEDLSRLEQVFAGRPCCLLAVSWCSDDGFVKPRPDMPPHKTATLPAALGTEWTLLGYDVADAFMISGLSNCGYEPKTVEALRTVWGGRLNVHHLFTGVADAFAFKPVTDRRVPEHAPFLVYGLFRLRSATARRDVP